MRAVRFHGNRDIRLDEIEEPVCGEGQVKVCTSSFFFSFVCLISVCGWRMKHMYC